MYLDEDSYSDYIAAYKTFIVNSARVLVRELGTAVTGDTLIQKANEIFEFEKQIAMVSAHMTWNVF